MSKYKIEVPNMQNRNNDAKKGNQQLDLENLNQSKWERGFFFLIEFLIDSMTAFVLEQIGSALGSMQTEIDGIKHKLALQVRFWLGVENNG